MRDTTVSKKLFLAAAGVFFLLPSVAFGWQNGLGRTPTMGWSSWNYYGCSRLNEQAILETAEAMVAKHPANWEGKSISLKDAGYIYVDLDDCWGLTYRSALDELLVNTTRFPHCTDANGGMKWLGDTLHNMGLKFGIYSCCGTSTCANSGTSQMGSYGYDQIDAATFASWGVDLLKHDFCYVPNYEYGSQLYWKMHNAIIETGRDIVFSVCEWGWNDPRVWTWGDSVGHQWRIDTDIYASWGRIVQIIDGYIDHRIHTYTKPGSYGDMDMLEVGNGLGSTTEDQSHFAIWAMCASPLIMGNNLTTMSEQVFTILSNREVIAVNQDSLGIGAHRVRQSNNVDLWVKKLSSPDSMAQRTYAVCFLNRGTSTGSGTVNWSDIGETSTSETYSVRDLLNHTSTTATGSYTANGIAGHGVAMFRLTRGTTGISDAKGGGRVPTQIAIRRISRGVEIFVPVSNSRVQMFDLQGREIVSFTASIPSWYRVSEIASGSGMYIVRVKTTGGAMVERRALLLR